MDPSHKPLSCPHQVDDVVEIAVAEMRRAHPRWGSRRIQTVETRHPHRIRSSSARQRPLRPVTNGPAEYIESPDSCIKARTPRRRSEPHDRRSCPVDDRVPSKMSDPSCKNWQVSAIGSPAAIAMTDQPEWEKVAQMATELATGRVFVLPGGRVKDPAVQIVDLFCGAGGLSAGFEMLGRRTGLCAVVGAADFESEYRDTFETNLGVRPSDADLGEIAADPTAIESFINSLELDRDRPLILAGGPPCQGFSAHRKRHWSSEDVRNQLVPAFARIAVALSPEVVVMENVPELLSGKYWAHFETFRDQLEAAGYSVSAQIHNLAGFGVAQERFRALVIASRRPIGGPSPVLTGSEFRTVWQQIGHLPAIEPGSAWPLDPMHQCSRHRKSTIDVIRQVPIDGGNRPKGVGPACLQNVDGFRDVYGRLAWDRPSVTITGSARNPASGRYVHPDQNRGLSLREAALIQGFPDNYLFTGTNGSRYQQVGNAVPARFAVILAAHLVRHILEPAYNPIGADRLSTPARDSFSSSLWGLKSGAAG